MVRPEKLRHLIVERLVVVLPVSRVYYQVVLLSVLELEKSGHVLYGVPVGFLQTRGREGHRDDFGSDVGEVQVEFLVDGSVFRACDYLSD